MADEKPDNPTHEHQSSARTYAGVSVDHPAIVNLIRSVAKEHGVGDASVQRAMKLSGMPKEVVTEHMKRMKDEQK